jgi:hypothetical protein
VLSPVLIFYHRISPFIPWSRPHLGHKYSTAQKVAQKTDDTLEKYNYEGLIKCFWNLAHSLGCTPIQRPSLGSGLS